MSKEVRNEQQGICTHPQTTYMFGNTYCAVCKDWLHAGPPLSVPTESLLPVPTELEKAVKRWVDAKRAEVLREDTKGELQLEVRKQEQDVEAAIYEEFENELDRKRG